MKKIMCFCLFITAFMFFFTSALTAETYNPSSFGVSEKEGEYTYSLNFPWRLAEKDKPPSISVDIRYFKEKLTDEELLDPVKTTAGCLFIGTLIEGGNNTIIVPRSGWLLVTPAITMINPLGFDLFPADKDGITCFGEDEITDFVEEDKPRVNKIWIDLSLQTTFIDIGAAAAYESTNIHNVVLISFTTHDPQVVLTRFRILVNAGPADPANADDLKMLGYFAGGYSPKYSIPVNFAIMSPGEKLEELEALKKIIEMEY